MKNTRIIGMVLLGVWAFAAVGCGLSADLNALRPTDDDDITDTSTDTSGTEITDCEDAADCDAEAPYCVDGDCVVCEITAHCGAGEWCDNNECVDCDDDRHCGASCTACEHPNRFCNDAGDACVECNVSSHCTAGSWCNAGTCEECNTAGHCGTECLPCTDDTPACAEDGNTCVECATHADCPGPIGVCTPDNTCTCLAHDTDPKANCSADADCGDTDYACAMDYNDTDPAVDTDQDHFACLRRCPTPTAMSEGIICAPREVPDGGNLPRVWAPATSCFAFSQHVEETACTALNVVPCSATHGSFTYLDANCTGSTCTYPCRTAGDCLADEECNSSDVCAMP